MARVCSKCKRVCGPHQPDPCLGHLPGVTGACCGHGDPAEAFIGWGENGPTIRGFWVDEEWRNEVARYERETEVDEFVKIPIQVSREAFDDSEELSDEDALELGRFYEMVIRDYLSLFGKRSDLVVK